MTESFPRQLARTRRFTLGEPRSFAICGGGSRLLFLRALGGEDPRTALWLIDLADGEERLLADPTRIDVGGSLAPEEQARRERVRETASGVVAFAADEAGDTVVFGLAGDIWHADVRSGEVRPLPARPGSCVPRVDPTGRHVAYATGRELRVLDIDSGEDRLLAGEEAETVFWGRAEFAAAEEMDRTHGFWWAPDGSALLAARVDEADVQQWWIADPAHPDRPPSAVRYPSAGTPNADVTVHVVRLDGSRTAVEWDRSGFPYLAHASWSGGHPPLLQVQARDQRAVQVLAVDVETGGTTVLHEDRDPVWVELFSGVPAWCGDEVVRIADVDGVRRLLVGDRSVTGDDLHVRAVGGVADRDVIFTASRGDPTQVHLFRWTGTGVEQLSDGAGVHAATAADGTVVMSAASLDRHGQQHTVRRGDARRVVRSVAAEPVLSPTVRMLTLGPRGLRGGLLLPRDHAPGTRLPVLVDPYGGPHAQRVLATRRLWLEPQWWADQGFAVLVVDGRGTPGRSPAWEREIHLDLATPVLEDQVDALHAAAAAEPDLDLERVAIRGWSFGGYLAALAVLRRPDVFHAAVAGAPVTDWRLYDTHYTERYLGMPQERPDVYRASSLLDDAPSLSRPLLLVHGLADDNVVAAHTLRLSQRLSEHGRSHRVLPLSGITHMTPQEAVAENLLLLQLEFLRSALD